MSLVKENSLFLTIPYARILQALAQRSKTKIYLVGGAIRNLFVGQENADFDFATSRGALSLARAFARKIRGAYVLLDAEHGCARVARKESGKLLTFDFADFRAADLRGDLAHRDFTINTLAADLYRVSEEKSAQSILIDAHQGIKDLKARKIRMVSAKAFAEDPLRLLRAFSLKAVFGFTIELRTAQRIKKDKDLISSVARERVRDELFKIFSSPRTFSTLKAMHAIGLLEKIIPQMSLMYHLPQGGYHHLSLLEHSFETIHQLEKIFDEVKSDKDIKAYLEEPIASGRSRQALMKFAALLHDIGKPQTHRQEKGKTTFHGHEHVGRGIIRPIIKMLKMSTAEKNMIEDMVLYHLRPGYLSNFKEPSARAIFRYFRDTKKEAVSVLLLSLADQRSTLGPLTTKSALAHHEKIVRKLLAQYFCKAQEKKQQRLITGHDLIKKLKLSPSPVFKKILGAVEEQQALGKIATLKEALALAKRIAERDKD